MQLQVPTDILRGIEAHRSKRGSHRRYSQELKTATVAWAKPLLSEYSIQTLASSLGIGWDTLNAWLSKAPPTGGGGRYDRTTAAAEKAGFLPVRVTDAPEPEVTPVETMVEVVTRGGRAIRLRWPIAPAILSDIVKTVESLS